MGIFHRRFRASRDEVWLVETELVQKIDALVKSSTHPYRWMVQGTNV